MIFQLFKWHFDINWYKFEKRWADVFQIYPNAIHFNPPQFCPSLSLLIFPVFCLSSSMVLSRYFLISVNSMTTWSMLKLPKIAWPSPFNMRTDQSSRIDHFLTILPYYSFCKMSKNGNTSPLFKILFLKIIWIYLRLVILALFKSEIAA